MALRDAFNTILNRNTYYRDAYRFLVRASFIQSCIIAFLFIAFLGTILLTHVQHDYFATTSDGRIMPLEPHLDINATLPQSVQ